MFKWYEDQLLPRIIDKLLGTGECARLRARALSALEGVEGEVVELGFGSGLNLPHYPPGITKIHGVDPSIVGQKLARARLEASPIPVAFPALDGAALPFEDQSLDGAVSTWTLCTIPDLQGALQEVRRVLKPGAPFIFLEHGLSPDQGVAQWQHRINPMQKCLGGGCHLNRQIDVSIRDGGFEILHLDTYYMKAPRFAGYMYEGLARAPKA